MDCEVRVKASLIVAVLLFGLFSVSARHRANSSSGPPASDQTAILVGAGDVADCKDLSGAEATARLLDQIPGIVMVVGSPRIPNHLRIAPGSLRPLRPGAKNKESGARIRRAATGKADLSPRLPGGRL